MVSIVSAVMKRQGPGTPSDLNHYQHAPRHRGSDCRPRSDNRACLHLDVASKYRLYLSGVPTSLPLWHAGGPCVGHIPSVTLLPLCADHNSWPAQLTIGLMERAKERPTACGALAECCVSVRLPLVDFTPDAHRARNTLGWGAGCHGTRNPNSQPCTHSPAPAPCSGHSATHTCCPLPNASFKEVRVPKKSKPLGRLLEATVALLSQLEESLCKESFYKEKGKEKRGVMTTEGQSKPFQVLTQANWFVKSPVSEQEHEALSCHATQLGRCALPAALYKLVKTPFV